MLNVTTAKLAGIPGNSGWSQIYEFTPHDENKLSTHGKMFAIVASDESKSGIDAIGIGREFFSKLQLDYYSSEESNLFDTLQEVLTKNSYEFKTKYNLSEIIVMVAVSDVLYMACQGQGEIMISRRGLLAKIVEGYANQVIPASGYAQDGDTFILATKVFYSVIPAGILRAALSSKSPDSAIEMFTNLIRISQSPGSLGALVVRFQKDLPLPKFESPKVASFKPDTKEIKNKIGGFLNSLSQKLPRKNVYLKTNLTEDVSPESKKTTFSIALILLVLLAVSIGFGIRQKKINDFKNKYQNILIDAKDELDQAVSLASVSPDKSRELFSDAEQKVKELDALNIKDSELGDLKQKINDGRAAILGEYKVSPEMFLDLTLLSSGFNGSTLAYSEGLVYVLDSHGSRIVSVNTGSKKSKVVAGPSVINSPTDLACYEDKVYIAQNDGIYQVDSGSNKVIEKSWQDSALIAAFAGNIYVIDKSGGQIYRYQRSGISSASFGEKQDWLSPGVNANFSNLKQISIDGSIYALFPNAKILKYSQGSPLNFNITGVSPEIGNIDAISASPDNADIYLLDKAGKRVVVTDKKGIYKAQYIDDQIASAINLVVSEADKKIILLTGDKLYSIDIKHI